MTASDLKPVALTLYQQLTKLAGPLAAYLLRRRLAQGKEDPKRVPERRGEASVARPEGPLVWFHCASVGESLSVLPLIEQLSMARGDLHFLVTSGTLTSAQLMAERLPENAIHQYVPLDHPLYCRRFFEHWHPEMGVIIESELWPNLILTAQRYGVQLVLANARLSASSFKGWRKARKSIGRLLNAFDIVLAQEEKSAERFRLLGAANLSVPGNLKDDALPLPYDKTTLHTLGKQLENRPLWVAASTHETEESLVADTHVRLKKEVPDLLTVIVPRHPVRGDSIAEELTAKGMHVAQRSKDELPQSGTDIYLADTLGEIGMFYRLSPIAFLGGSFVDVGGHNPLEAARLDCAIVLGPKMFNFEVSTTNLLEAGAAVSTTSSDEFAAAVLNLLKNKTDCEARATKAKKVADDATGVAVRISAMLLPLLPPSPAPTGENAL